MSEQDKALVRRLFDEVVNKGNLDVIQELVASEHLAHHGDEEHQGIEGFRRGVADMRSWFPDLHCAIEELIAEDDRVAAHVTFSGTHTGELGGIAPTGKQVRFTETVIIRIAGGKWAEDWSDADALGMLTQLGGRLAEDRTTADALGLLKRLKIVSNR